MPAPTNKSQAYRISKRSILSRGTHSTVYKGTDTAGNDLAFKILNLSKLPCVAKRQSKQETHILRKLYHLQSTPNLLDVIERGLEICYVMPLIQGKNMKSLLIKHPNGIPDNLAPFLFKSILLAVKEIHNAGVCHLNLSLDNLIFDTKTSNIKVIGFQFAKETKINWNGVYVPVFHRDFCGSIPYAAPEMIAQDEYDGTKVDIWAVGVIFYALIFNQLPFTDFENKADAIFKKITEKAIYYPPYISPKLLSLFESIFSVTDPPSRPSAAELLEHPYFFCTRKYAGPWTRDQTANCK